MSVKSFKEKSIMSKNIVLQDYQISKIDRNLLNNHQSFLLWFTGLSGSGKSTIANAVEDALHRLGKHTYTLDGDNIRHGLNKDLGFTAEGRTENIRRIAEVANLMIDAGIIVLAAFVSPYEKNRNEIKNIVGKENYIEIFVDTPLGICEERDVKGLYKKAREGTIKDFTGISAPYETPKNPDIIIKTHQMSIPKSVEKILNYIGEKL